VGELSRCGWATSAPEYVAYHDDEWGRPLRGVTAMFERLSLEGFQSGLSWLVILRKRPAFRTAFAGFEPAAVARFDDADVARLLADAGIVRNRLKIEATVGNARAFLEVQREFGSFDRYLWGFVDGRPVVNRPSAQGVLPASTPLSDLIAKDLKKRGFRFVGTTIVYAYLQAVGVVNDHSQVCFLCPSASAARSIRRSR
jgi:DNA-3-methyladenine glycosylase I